MGVTGTRLNLEGGRERIEEEMALLMPSPSPWMPLPRILPGVSDLPARGSAFSGFGTAHKGPW